MLSTGVHAYHGQHQPDATMYAGYRPGPAAGKGQDGRSGPPGSEVPDIDPSSNVYIRGATSSSHTHLSHPQHHLPTVDEEELMPDQEPDLAECAAAALADAPTATMLGAGASPTPESCNPPSRVLIVRNVHANAPDDELQDIFQAFGDVQGMHLGARAAHGVVVVAYYDLRAAVSAQSTLDGTLVNKAPILVGFSVVPRSRDGRARVSQGQVTIFNLDPETSNDQLVWLFSKFGDVQGISQSPARPTQKFITFYDTRHAGAAMRAMNRAEALGKIPSHVTPAQIAALRTVTSGPNLTTPAAALQQNQGLDATAAAAQAAAAGNAGNGGVLAARHRSSSWDSLQASSATMEGLLHLVNQQQMREARDAAAAAGQGGGAGGGRDAFGQLASLDPLAAAASARSLPLSDSASSIAGVPGSLLMQAGQANKAGTGAGGGAGQPRHASNGADGANNHAAAATAAAAMQQQLQLLQASDAAQMLMGLNLGAGGAVAASAAAAMGTGVDPHMIGGGGRGGGHGWPGLDAAGAGLLPGSGDGGAGMDAASMWSSALLGAGHPAGGLPPHLNPLAALHELQLRQAAAAAAHQQQMAALQAAAAAGGLGQFGAAANLQAAAQILQAAGLGPLGAPTNPYLASAMAAAAAGPHAAYNANMAAQILQQAGLGLPGLGGYHAGGGGPNGQGGLGGMGGGAGHHGMGGQRGGMPDLAARSGGRLSRRTTDPVAEAERKAQQEKLYALDLEKIARGEDRRTTLMIKNIPNKYTQKMLLATVDEVFRGMYDFFYLPIDFKNKCNVGYAFINMTQPAHIIPLVQRFNHKKWERFNSEKVCSISYARIQGRAALVQHFQNSSLMHEDKRCRPILFTVDDATGEAGEQEPFPAPSGAAGGISGSTGGGSTLSLGAMHGGGSGSASGTRLSGLAGSSASLVRSNEGSTNSLRDLATGSGGGGGSGGTAHRHHALQHHGLA